MIEMFLVFRLESRGLAERPKLLNFKLYEHVDVQTMDVWKKKIHKAVFSVCCTDYPADCNRLD